MNILSDFKQIRHFIFDIDGVLTGGHLLVNSDGSLLRTMNIRDGYALQLAVKQGYRITILSGAKGDMLVKRFAGLGITEVFLGVEEKMHVFRRLQIQREETLYMGDDMPDIEVMQQVFLPCCPADACPEIQQISRYISSHNGGQGCVRDVLEKTLKLNDHWK